MPDHKQYSRAEVEARSTADATLLVIHNRVYDVTPFLDEHPGGHEVLVGVGGTDATEDFDDIGHSVDARELMAKFLVGEIVEHERVEKKKKSHNWEDVSGAGSSGGLSWWLPFLVAVVAALVWLYFT